MLPRIDFRSGRPVYLQILDHMKASAAAGTLRPGEELPPIGALAQQLRVNRNAIAKAYTELDRVGLIEFRDGGYFVRSSRGPANRNVRRKRLAAEIGQAPAAIRSTVANSLIAVAQRLLLGKNFHASRVLEEIKSDATAQPDRAAFLESVSARAEGVLGVRPVFVEDRAEVLSLVHHAPALRSARAPVMFGSDLLLPVFADEEVIGVLRLAPKSDGQEYEAGDRHFLAAFGDEVSRAFDHFQQRHERQESEYARDIQQSLLPREIPQLPGFTIAGAWQPARSVGGDYYDVFRLSETQLALVIGDVSGKGMPAALLMANLQATVKAYASMQPEPKELCALVNRAICQSIPSGKFITFFYAVLDAASRRITYVSAGHNPPLLVRRDGTTARLDVGGPVLGIFPAAPFQSAAVEWSDGDRLLMFTDGITEAADGAEEEFGEDRLIAMLAEHQNASAAELRDTIMQAVASFCGEDFADDATLVAVAGE